MERAEYYFLDIDIPNRISNLEKYFMNGGLLFSYPHAAAAPIHWDFKSMKPSRWLNAVFVHAKGHEQVLRAYGFDKPIHIVGWTYCDILPFKPISDLKTVLFAPYHPNINSGYLSKYYIEANQKAFKKVHAFCKAFGIELVCRYIGELHQNGLQPEDDVFYVSGKLDLSHSEIDNSDLVVSGHTFSYLSIARGKPTVMFGQNIHPHIGKSDKYLEFMPSWKQVKDLMMYPFELFSFSDPGKLFNIACSSGDIIFKWRERMLGEAFDATQFANIVSSYKKEFS